MYTSDQPRDTRCRAQKAFNSMHPASWSVLASGSSFSCCRAVQYGYLGSTEVAPSMEFLRLLRTSYYLGHGDGHDVVLARYGWVTLPLRYDGSVHAVRVE